MIFLADLALSVRPGHPSARRSDGKVVERAGEKKPAGEKSGRKARAVLCCCGGRVGCAAWRSGGMVALSLRAYNACEENSDACGVDVVSLCAPPWCCRSKGEPDGRVVFSLKRSLRVEQTRLVRLRMNRAHGQVCVWDALHPCLTRTPRRAMRANEETVLVGTLVVLVPYR